MYGISSPHKSVAIVITNVLGVTLISHLTAVIKLIPLLYSKRSQSRINFCDFAAVLPVRLLQLVT